MKKAIIFSLFILSFFASARAEEPNRALTLYQVKPDTYFGYSKPRPFEFLQNVPRDYKYIAKNTFRKENIPAIVAVTALTLVLLPNDQKLYEKAQKLGRKNDISQKDNTKTFWSFKGLPLFRGPTDTGSWLYYIGDGWTHMTIGAIFFGYGKLGGDMRALRTAYALFEGITCSAIADQTIKHLTGRESPDGATEPGGVWRFFPNQIQYHKHVSHYDAFPSGHVATSVVTLTVISENYPEYNYIVLPVGFTLLALVQFQMMNNGAHWASDYPFGIAMGYVFAKIALNNNRVVINKKAETSSMELLPALGRDYLGLELRYHL